MSTRDPIGVALASVGAGATSGGSVVTVGLLAFRSLQRGGAGTADADAQFLALSVSLMVGIGVAASLTVALTRPITDLWQRGVATTIAAFFAAILAAGTAPADLIGGRLGLVTYLALLLAAARYTTRRARRAAAP